MVAPGAWAVVARTRRTGCCGSPVHATRVGSDGDTTHGSSTAGGLAGVPSGARGAQRTKPVRPPSAALGAAQTALTTSPLVWAVTPSGPNTGNLRRSVRASGPVTSVGGPPASAPPPVATVGSDRSPVLNQP